jgi:cytoskeleton protein RodZ
LRQNTRVPRIGETLREARIRQGVDIGEVERATKIRAKYLRALENEEFDLLPGPTFVRSFLKTYAEHLGLDARMLVEEFRADHEGLPEEEPPPALGGGGAAPGRRREPGRYERRAPGPGVIIGGAVAALLVLFLVLGLTGNGGEPRGEGAGDEAAEREAEEERPRRRGRSEQRARPRTVTLRVTPEGPTYACIDRGAGKTPVFEGSLTSTRTFRGRRLRLNLGRPSARVKVNGRNVDLGSETRPVGFSFSPGKRPKALPLSERPCV